MPLRNVETLYREYDRLTRVTRVSRVSRVIQGGYPGGLAETDSRWPNEVLTHNGIYTISARAPVYVRAYHEGLIASSSATLARRRAGTPGETHRYACRPASYSLYSKTIQREFD